MDKKSTEIKNIGLPGHFIILTGIILCVLSLLVGCMQKNAIVMTVLGPMPAQSLGFTLIHEHILVDFAGAESSGYHRWDRDMVEHKVLPYLHQAYELGFRTVAECTPAYLGRDPLLLKSISQKSGVQIITNTGYYGAVRNKYLPQHAFTETAAQLAERWINEWKNGIENSGVRPGFIKIAVDDDDTLSVLHQKLVRAAAITHLATGLVIMSHTGPEKPLFAQLEILRQEGVSPQAMVWTHAQQGTQQAHILAAKMGVWVSLDNVNADSANIELYTRYLQNFKNNGLLNRVLLSHDAGWYHVGEPDGGQFRDFSPLLALLVPALKNIGFSDNDIYQLLVVNPQKVLTIRVWKLSNNKP